MGRTITYYNGLCDASAVDVVGNRMIVATDEREKSTKRNALHVYTLGNPDSVKVDLTTVLGENQTEADLEGVARIGNRQYWIGAHSTNGDGEPQPGRRVLFATELQGDGVVPVPGNYRTLIADLSSDPRYTMFDIDAASRRAPETDNGLSIEGLSAVGTTLLIGLRSPLTDGKALIVPLLDGPAVVAGVAPARFGAPIVLDLGGRGIRDLASMDGGTAILAGPSGDSGDFKLFTLVDGTLGTGPEIDFDDLHVEGMATTADGKLLFVSDDGDVCIDGKKCKKLPDAKRRFRVLTVDA